MTTDDPLYEDLAAKVKTDDCHRCGKSGLIKNRYDKTINIMTVIRKDQSKPDYVRGNLITVHDACKGKDEM